MFLICGEALYDLFTAEDGTAGGLRIDARPGGSPYNVAIGMARLGGCSALLTGISNDMLGARLAGVLEAEGVDDSYLVRTGRRTTLSLVGVDPDGHPAYTFYGIGSADCSLTAADLPQLSNAIRGLHFGSYSIAVQPVADAFADLAQREAGRFISLDPNVRPTIEPDMQVWRNRINALLPVTNLVKVSDEDIAALYPGTDPEAVIGDWSRAGPALVVLTRGGSEVVAIHAGQSTRVNPAPVDVADTVGAGDTFMAALLTMVSQTSDPTSHLAEIGTDQVEKMLLYAATAAGITCTRRGADLPRSADMPVLAMNQ